VTGVLELQRFALRYDEGRLAESVDALERLVEAQPGITAWRPLLALALADAGRMDEARAELEDLSSDLRALSRDMFRIPALWALAMVAATAGDPQRCALLYEQLTPYAGRTGGGMGIIAIGVVDVALGALATALGRNDEAEGHFEAAAAWCTRVGAAPSLASTRLEWARMLLSRHQPGDAQRARELLRQALATAEKLGLRSIQQRAVTLLA
jgi:tetratricopeptide (TPR) repeat protein